MAYYQGDYYQGDYYQGDPFIGALFATGASWLAKKLFKRKLSTVGKTELARRTTTGLRRAAGIGVGLAAATGMQIPIPGTPFQMTPGAFLPGGTPLFGRRSVSLNMPVGPTGYTAPPGGCCPTGYHLAKDQSGRCVRNRSMNVANPRALRRSLRRVAGFGKLAQRSKRDIRRAAKAIGA